MRPRAAGSWQGNPSLSGSPANPRALKSMTGSVFVDSNAEPITIKISMG
jgi:hypothetical protein